MATYNFPGITYGGQASPDSLVAAIARISSLPTAADNSAAVLSALQGTTIPVDAVQGAWPTATENASAVWSHQLP